MKVVKGILKTILVLGLLGLALWIGLISFIMSIF